jgi:hypothetical protein
LKVIGEKRNIVFVSSSLRFILALISEPMASMSSRSLSCPMRPVNERILLSEKKARLELVTAKTESDKLSRVRMENIYRNFLLPVRACQ